MENRVLFTNVNVFDGVNDTLKRQDVLIENNLIKHMGKNLEADSGTTIIDGRGNTLMPGLHDMHVHMSAYTPLLNARQEITPLHAGAMGILRAKQMIMNGFTTVRDAGGPSKYIQKIVDAGVSPGPRVYPSEAWISQTGGHADFRATNDPHPSMCACNYNWFDNYLGVVVDGKAEIMRAVRENFHLGATQIKLMVSGGVATPTDPLHTVQFTPEEIRAAVEVADLWGTYVFAHILNERSLIMSVENGIKGLEHVPTLNDKTAALILENDCMFGTCVTPVLGWSEEEAKRSYPGPLFEKWKKVRDQARAMLETVQRNPKLLERMTYSSDLVGPWENALERDMGANMEFQFLAEYFDAADILRIFTSNGAKYNSLTGLNNPYQDGPLGVISEGAYADVLLVNGNPLNDVTLLTDPSQNLLIIMKDGVFYKNTLV